MTTTTSIRGMMRINNCIDDQLMVDVAHTAIEEANARAKENGADVPEFIKAKRKATERHASG